jgi:transposase
MSQAEEIGAWVGIDWADKEHRIVLEEAATGRRISMAVGQSPEELHEWLSGLQSRYAGRRVAMALEQSRGALFYVLSRYEFIDLYPVNPKTLASYRDALRPSGAKDDPDDAALVLELLLRHRDRLRLWKADDAQTRQLRLLVEYRRKLVDDRTGLANQLTQLLKESFPQALRWAGGLDTKQAFDFLLRWPTLAAVRQARTQQLRAFYRTHYHSAEHIDKQIDSIRTAVALIDDPAIVAACSTMIIAIAGQLRVLRESIAQFDCSIDELFAHHQDASIFKSFPNAGAVLAPRLAVAFGTDRDRYSAAVELAQWSGIAPVTRRSGGSMVVCTRWASPKFLKQTFHEYARVSIAASAWARAFYDQQRLRGATHHAAVRALAYRWIRIMFRCWKDRVPYCEVTYQQALRRRGSPLAGRLAA